jgi:hypothetical protein
MRLTAGMIRQAGEEPAPGAPVQPVETSLTRHHLRVAANQSIRGLDHRPDLEMRNLNPLAQSTPACMQQRLGRARVQRIGASFAST